MLEGTGSEAQLVVPLSEGLINEITEAAHSSGAEGGYKKSFFIHISAAGNIWHIRCGQNDLITIDGGFGVIFHDPNDAILFRSFGISEDESGGLHDSKLVDDGIDGNHTTSQRRTIVTQSELSIEQGIKVK